MGLNDGLLETFIFNVAYTDYACVTVKVVINFTKSMYTVYDSRGRILVRKEKVPQMELNILKKQINDFITDGGKLRGFTPPYGFGGKFI